MLTNDLFKLSGFQAEFDKRWKEVTKAPYVVFLEYVLGDNSLRSWFNSMDPVKELKDEYQRYISNGEGFRVQIITGYKSKSEIVKEILDDLLKYSDFKYGPDVD